MANYKYLNGTDEGLSRLSATLYRASDHVTESYCDDGIDELLREASVAIDILRDKLPKPSDPYPLEREVGTGEEGE